ncbi:phosphotransferase [Reticulibacter mediterranei]|uniref:Phosphocarrier protein HPr n=1 Tax=Reticulibacter mediterranei TaxID=2778369 RepID=A0A8J3IGU8_9CHLR|nr:HPr family phosphocarrier protein [Reticulibacter mediterranei]GHO95249.1 phosphotransferase [Reticulibacter mediterranei]
MSASNEAVVQHKVGLHARPAAIFVRQAAKYSSRITIENLTKGTSPANAKSILSVMTAAVRMGDHVRIAAEGDDEQAAVEVLSTLIQSNFDETE